MIYYLGYYNSTQSGEVTLNTSNAAVFKMGYIIRKIKQTNKSFKVVSCATRQRFGKNQLKTIEQDGYEEIYLPTYRFKGIFRKIQSILNAIEVKKFLKTVKKEDTLIVYHSPSLCKKVLNAKKKKSFNLVLEIEEIYSVDEKNPLSKSVKENELQLISCADSYIIVNDLIYEKYINNGKPYVVVYGVYDGEKKESKEKGEGVNLLFSGSIDRVRGVEMAVETAKYLPQKYTLHITGKGEEGFTKQLKQSIDEHNKKQDCAKIVFHGQLTNEELEDLASTCDIGLNLQDVNNPFESVSFPSKITFYMLNGLTVVSTEMSSVKASSLSESIQFCEYTPQGVATAILKVEIKEKTANYQAITNLDKKIKDSIQYMI